MWYSMLDLQLTASPEIVALVVAQEQSPWFSGHFPDNPILPGIAQLHMVADIIARARQEPLTITRLHRIKFKRLVRPGERLEIRAVPADPDGLYTFRITHAHQDVCAGTMSLDRKQHHTKHL